MNPCRKNYKKYTMFSIDVYESEILLLSYQKIEDVIIRLLR